MGDRIKGFLLERIFSKLMLVASVVHIFVNLEKKFTFGQFFVFFVFLLLKQYFWFFLNLFYLVKKVYRKRKKLILCEKEIKYPLLYFLVKFKLFENWKINWKFVLNNVSKSYISFNVYCISTRYAKKID